MDIIQIEDKNLAHYSYVLISNGKIALIDPARNPQPYYDLAKKHQADIVAVIETHPHADFVSSHSEIHKTTGATIYVSKLLGAEYEHIGFDEGDTIYIGNISLKALNTPGHSPDSICIVATDENGKEKAVFTGDTLFIGDCGRPDLREAAGAITAAREVLARQMYHSLRDKLMNLPDEVLVYPAHGAGSLCGRGLSANNSSTIGIEKAGNWCLQKMSEEDFVNELLFNQPFVPKYFPYDVALNKKGAPNYADSIAALKISEEVPSLKDLIIIDTRDEADFKKGYFKNAVNLMDDIKFETWLGSIVSPGEKFYLMAENKNKLQSLIERVARIGYEGQIEEAFVASGKITGETIDKLDVDDFRKNRSNYTVMDIRNPSEIKEKKIFDHTLDIPLYELRERVSEIPTEKPVVVHCAGGYRSAAGVGIIKNLLPNGMKIFDLGEVVKTF
jgi:glyoxylase-like metal-dependent hydrolase (beta-lactamase superfamily II)/rhodanese-related sulfurtransferase